VGNQVPLLFISKPHKYKKPTKYNMARKLIEHPLLDRFLEEFGINRTIAIRIIREAESRGICPFDFYRPIVKKKKELAAIKEKYNVSNQTASRIRGTAIKLGFQNPLDYVYIDGSKGRIRHNGSIVFHKTDKGWRQASVQEGIEYASSKNY
jgi:FMN phosphatase YigB (HAD superfamily)